MSERKKLEAFGWGALFGVGVVLVFADFYPTWNEYMGTAVVFGVVGVLIRRMMD